LVAALVVLGDPQAALIVAVFVGLSFAHLLRSDRRPAFFDVLFALAALAGAVGFVFGLFDEIVPYDELTHAFTTFWVSLTFYFLFYGGAVPGRRAFALGDLGVHPGGHSWRLLEIFEWFLSASTRWPTPLVTCLWTVAAPWQRRLWRSRCAVADIVSRRVTIRPELREDPETEVRLLRCGTMTPAIGQQEAKNRGFLEEALTCPGG
jgi:hypothetical protein